MLGAFLSGHGMAWDWVGLLSQCHGLGVSVLVSGVRVLHWGLDSWVYPGDV